MTWSYTGNPANSDLDALRFRLGDTDPADQQFSDEELDYLLAEKSTVPLAALEAARQLHFRYSKLVDKTVGDLKISYGQRAGRYKELISQLKRDSVWLSAMPYAGGIRESDKDSVEEDVDRVKPNFKLGMHDNPAPGTDPATDDICDS